MRNGARGDLARVLTQDVPRVASGAAVEAAWVAAHLVMYPLGSLPGSAERASRHRGDRGPRRLGLVHQDLAAATTPILLVHGIVDNHSIFTLLDHALRRRGFENVAAYDYGLLTKDVPEAAALLGEAITTLAHRSGHDRIHVVGHSLGGLLARWFVQRLGGDAYVHTLVTLGTPHGGTEMARLAPMVPIVRQLSPRSQVIRRLAEPAPGCTTRFLAFASDIDHLVVPARNALVEHPDLDATNVTVRGVGHLSLPNNRRVAARIAHTLGERDRAAHPSSSRSVPNPSGATVPV